MTHTGHSPHTNLAILEDVVDLRVDDETHRFLVVCGPDQTERSLLTKEFDRASTEADRHRRAGDLWRDMRDARRAIRG